MVRRLLQFLEREQRGLHEAALVLGIFALISQLLAFFRDRLFAREFGAGKTLDIYYAAFRVPDLIFIVSASMVSLSVLIPFLSRKLAEGKDEARIFLDTLFSAFFLGVALIGAAAYLAAPALVSVFFPGFSAEAAAETVLLMRIMLLQPVLLGISNLYASITQLERRFFIYAISPVLYNVGIIAGALFLYPLLGLAGLAWGIVLGALLHMAVQIPTLRTARLLPQLTFRPRWRELRAVIAVSLPRTLALSSQNLSVLALTALGSLFGAGSIAVFNFAWNLQSVPLSIIGASYSLAAFPTLSLLWNGGAREKFLDTLSLAVRHILFWSFPALALFIVLRAQIVRVILGAGAFDWTDTRLTAASLALFAVSVVAQSLVLLFTRGFYAAGRTRAPLLISVAGALATVSFAFFFRWLFSAVPLVRFFVESLLRVSELPGTSVLALPLSYSLGALGMASAFWMFFSREFRKFGSPVWRTFWESFSAAVLMGFVAYGALNIFNEVFDIRTTFGIFMQGFLGGLAGAAAGVAVLYALGSVELRELSTALHRKFWKTRVIGPDPTETTF